MIRFICSITLTAFLYFPATSAKSAESGFALMYSDDELIPLQERRSQAFVGNFRNVILPLLLRDQARKLKGVTFRFPLRDETKDPNAFYNHDHMIVFSIASIKFWEDILTAEAWLRLNDYSTETVNDYALMLKYKKFLSPVPSPLSALCIPSDVVNDKNVEEDVDRSFSRTMTFIMLHELGHVYFNHPGYGLGNFEQIRRNEAEADNFAIEAMARLGEVPDIVTWLTIDTYRSPLPNDFTTEEGYAKYLATRTHPLSPARLKAIAESLVKNAEALVRVQGKSSSKQIFELMGLRINILSSMLMDPDIHDVMATRANILTEESLGPRRPDELIPKSCNASPIASNLDFSGTYKGKWTYLIADRQFDVSFNFVRHGDVVTGSILWGNVPGRLEGRMQGSTLYFRFELPFGNGSGKLALAGNGRLIGTWGDKDSPDDGGGIIIDR